MNLDWLKRAILLSLALYAVSLLTSLAGSELLGWLTLLLSIVYGLMQPRGDVRQVDIYGDADQAPSSLNSAPAFFCVGPDLALLALLVVVTLAYFFNAAPDAKLVTVLGQIRWIPLLYGLTYGLRWAGMSRRIFPFLAVIAILVSIHGIQETFTGWDFIRGRPDVYLANNPTEAHLYYRASGLFSMPTNFAHAANMSLCFLVAAILMGLGGTRKWRLFYSTSALFLFTAILLSFTRGAWIALFVAIVSLTSLLNLKLVALFAGALILLAGIAYLAIPQVHERVATMTNPNFPSNSERLELWNENIAIIKMHPILGIGLNENERLANEYNEMIGNKGGKVGNAHNTYLQFLSGSGALGLAAYLALIATMLMMTWRLWKIVPAQQTWHRTLILGAWGAQIALHVGGLTDCNFKNWQVNHQTMMVWSVICYLTWYYQEALNAARLKQAR